MSRAAWIWVGVLVLLLLLFWWWHRHHKKVVVVKPGLGTPLQSPAAAPAPSNVFSTIAKDAGGVASIFKGASSIFSSFGGGSSDDGDS